MDYSEATRTAIDACRTLMADYRREAFEAAPKGKRAKEAHSEADRYRDAAAALAAAEAA